MSENRYKLALEIQDACNITALAGLFHKVCLEVLHEDSCTGTAKVCKGRTARIVIAVVHPARRRAGQLLHTHPVEVVVREGDHLSISSPLSSV